MKYFHFNGYYCVNIQSWQHHKEPDSIACRAIAWKCMPHKVASTVQTTISTFIFSKIFVITVITINCGCKDYKMEKSFGSHKPLLAWNEHNRALQGTVYFYSILENQFQSAIILLWESLTYVPATPQLGAEGHYCCTAEFYSIWTCTWVVAKYCFGYVVMTALLRTNTIFWMRTFHIKC